ncbi:unnamed protein product [Triticum turgidum subsp. durum]|uniref:Uncharacterized protein n=1 Tax=Triticum turgidum subsp. durum TaxID=4567 RepID=A0A9R1BI61_TRITD|nr:unnamed protein product [Triticum turgidum subsp. durum]
MAAAAAVVGGMVASGVIKVVIKQIGSAIGGKIKLHKNLKRDLQKMQMTLESVEAALSDAERRSITDSSALLWVNRLKAAMYDISDMLDDFQSDTQSLISCSAIRIGPYLLVCDGSPDQCHFGAMRKRISMPDKMKKMQKCLQKITEDHQNYRLTPETCTNEQQLPDIRENAGTMVEAEIIGRAEEKLEILARLSGSASEHTTFVPIWGFGGIGKSTLARSVYNHPEFEKHSRVWIYVSQIFDLKKIGNTIISQLSRQQSQQILDLHSINIRLQELLAEKKNALIILDDLWEKRPSQLEELKSMLKQGKGCKVMVVVTTRDEGIANEISTVQPYNLPQLSDEMCWEIMRQKSKFETRDDKEWLEPIGKDIAKKCKGVALAAQSLGHILKSKSYGEWNSVRTNHIWNLSTSTDASSGHEVLGSLLLSYNLMPPYLKLFFAYCAILPKGRKMNKYKLIHQWIALGFMEPSSIFSNWQLGESYIMQLLEMSILRHSKMGPTPSSPARVKEEPQSPSRRPVARRPVKELPLAITEAWGRMLCYLGGGDVGGSSGSRAIVPEEWMAVVECYDTNKIVTLFTMHDLVHDLARSVMADEFNLTGPNCRYAWNIDCTKPLKSSTTSPEKLRALNIVRAAGTSWSKFHHDAIAPAKYVRVLHASVKSNRLFTSIGQLKQLRYLHAPNIQGRVDLGCIGCPNLKELPHSFANLKELVYLNLSESDNVLGLHEALANLSKLQHLELTACENLRGRPEVISNLTELRNLKLSGCMHHIFDSSSTDQTESFIDCICRLPNMEHLDLSFNGHPLISIPQSASCLQKLVLQNCSHVFRLPECVAKMDCQSLFGLLPMFSVTVEDSKCYTSLGLLEHVNPDKLYIDKLENVKSREEARSVKLIEKQRIEELTLKWTPKGKRSVDDMELLTELVPPTALQSFGIYGYISVSFPNWLMSIGNYLPNVVRMEMFDLPNCNSFPPLAQLPPNLQVLILKRMESLQEWNTTYSSGEDVGVSTNLTVENKEVPLHQWRLLHHLPAISDLRIKYCCDLASSPEITWALRSLKSLILRNSAQTKLSGWVAAAVVRRTYTSLKKLRIGYCPAITTLPDRYNNSQISKN